jgi:tetratricopeptide (TPR) repeat protein
MKLQPLAFKIAAGLILIFSTFAPADVVVLKNERRIQCDSVEESEKEVRCKIGQSTMTLARMNIAKIVKEAGKKETPPPKASSEKTKVQEPDRIKLSEKRTTEGIGQFKKKQYTAAISSFQEAYDLHRNEQTVTNLAMAYYHASDLGSAKSYFGELLVMIPESTLALNALGFIAAQQGDFTSAENHWRRSYALKADPMILQNLEVLANRAPEGARTTFSGIQREQIEQTISGYDQDAESHFQVKYDGGTVNPLLLREILRSLDDTYEKLRFELGVELPSDLEVILYPKKDFLQITGAPDWSGGFNDGRIHLPVGGLDSINSDVERVIIHELTHSLLDLKTGGKSPTWLQEGLAQYLDGSRSTGADVQLLSKLLSENSLPRLETLSASFSTSSPIQARIKYGASLSFIQFLVERHRFDTMPDFLNRIANGQTIQDASRMVFGADFADLEQQWHDALKNR